MSSPKLFRDMTPPEIAGHLGWLLHDTAKQLPVDATSRILLVRTADNLHVASNLSNDATAMLLRAAADQFASDGDGLPAIPRPSDS